MKNDKQDLLKKITQTKGIPLPIDAENGFGLGIQVFKIDSYAIKTQLNKKDKRLLIQNLQNPLFSKKYQKNVEIQKQNKLNRKKLTQQQFTIKSTDKYPFHELDRKKQKSRAYLPPHSKQSSRITFLEKGQRYQKLEKQKNQTAIIRHNSVERIIQKKKTPIPLKLAPLPKPLVKQEKVEEYIINFPPLQYQQLQNFENKQKQIEKKRQKLKKKLMRMKNQKGGQQQQLIQKQIQAIDSKQIIQQIIQNQNLNGYVNYYEQSDFDICDYVRGDFNIEQVQQQNVSKSHKIIIQNNTEKDDNKQQ